MATNHISRIIKRDGNSCHYCGCETVRHQVDHRGRMVGDRPANMATKDHIVPKSMGGLGKLDNFVLACRECNEHRGDNLYYCDCAFCMNVISNFMQRNFNADAFGPTKPRVWKHHDGTWVMSIGLNSYGWAKWESAMRQVPNAISSNTKIGA